MRRIAIFNLSRDRNLRMNFLKLTLLSRLFSTKHISTKNTLRTIRY